MAAEMTRLPLLNDLKLGALAENREDKTKRNRRVNIIHSFPCRGGNGRKLGGEKKSAAIRGEVKEIHKWKLNKRLHI